jgi:hypothetical protein
MRSQENEMADDLAQRLQALGRPDVMARVEADMGAMLRRHGLDLATLREAAPLEALAAATCCGACGELERCRSFLAGAADRPAEFCPNAATFVALAPPRP